jgi:glycosyltransferase involved in cell wall biosynthesis
MRPLKEELLPGEGRNLKRVVLVSNLVMHYRISVYNYFSRGFAEQGWEWRVLTNRLQPQSQIRPAFPIEEMPFRFANYKRRIQELNPGAVILFLHLKDRILWPLAHWMKFSGIPFASWTKTRNLDDPNNRLKNCLFDYVNVLSDGLILYSGNLLQNVPKRARTRAFTANNTINHHEFPAITESKEEIKRSLGIPFQKVVLFVGRMDVDGGRKRVDHLIEIFREMEGTGAGLVIVGSGMKPEWQARINPATTLYLGEVHDPENRQISRIFSMADVCAIPGHVGLGLNQALFFGLPVVTMEGKQPPEICNLHDGRNGFIVPENDSVELRRRIVQLLEDDLLRAKFSLAARQGFLEEASIEGMFHGFHECVEFLEAKRKRQQVSTFGN